MITTIRIWPALVILGLLATPALGADRGTEIAGNETVKGYVEPAQVYPGGLLLEARMDTGATTTSLNAPDLETFEQDGESWVRFTVENDDSNAVTFERPIKDEVAITAASTDGEDKRYVIELGLCVGDTFREVEVNLTDRSHMSYQLLVGRNFLEREMMVTSTDRMLHEPACEVPDAYR